MTYEEAKPLIEDAAAKVAAATAEAIGALDDPANTPGVKFNIEMKIGFLKNAKLRLEEALDSLKDAEAVDRLLEGLRSVKKDK